VTDFTLYYGMTDRPAEAHRAYCDFVGRLNAVLKAARPAPEVLLYYPIYDLWAEYLPVAGRLTAKSQSQRAQQLAASFIRLGETLQRNQIPFTLIDHEYLAAAKASPEGKLAIQGRSYGTLLLPDGAELPSAAAEVAAKLKEHGGRVIDERELAAASSGSSIAEVLRSGERISPPSPSIAVGRFVRDGHRVLLIANVGTEAYSGSMEADEAGDWHVMDPGTGRIHLARGDENARLSLSLAARQAVLLVCPAQGDGI